MLLTYTAPASYPPAPNKRRTEADILRGLARRGSSLYNKLKSDGWWAHWREIQEYIMPRRGRFLCDNPRKGRKVNQSVLTHAPVRAAGVGAAGLSHAITPKSSVWFTLSLKNKTLAKRRDVRIWLAECEDLLRQWMDSSNLYTAMKQIYLELIVFNTATMIVQEDFDTLLHCEVLTCGEYVLTTDKKGRANGLWREYESTVEQVVDKFGLDKVSATVKQNYQAGGENLDKPITVCHHIGANPDRRAGMEEARDLPFRDCSWEKGQEKFLHWGGYHENPIMAARWDTTAEDAYGRGPGMEALPECKALKLAITRKNQAMDRLVVPPMKAPATMKRQGANLLPGAINYMPAAEIAGAEFSTLFPNYNPRLDEIRKEIADLILAIEECFYNDVFMAITYMDGVQPRNEMELWQRLDEKLSQLGPMSERFETEFLEPFLDRLWAMAVRNGMLPDPPADIQEMPIDIEFVGPLARAQKSESISSMERTIAFIGNMAASFPTAGDKLNTDAAVDAYADMTHAPPSIIRDDAEVARIRAARLEEKQRQAMIEAAPAVNQVAAGAKLLSETDVGGGRSALSMMQ